MSEDLRTDPPLAGSEIDTLLGFLAFHRDTFRMKTAGLSDDQLAATVPPSSMTLGGMTKHLAFVESYWFSEVWLGNPLMAPFDTAPWDDDGDWEWHSAAADGGAAVRALWDDAVMRSRAITAEALTLPDGIERLSARADRSSGERYRLRFILVHMVEEYCRHNGHADLLRESIDGQTGE